MPDLQRPERLLNESDCLLEVIAVLFGSLGAFADAGPTGNASVGVDAGLPVDHTYRLDRALAQTAVTIATLRLVGENYRALFIWLHQVCSCPL